MPGMSVQLLFSGMWGPLLSRMVQYSQLCPKHPPPPPPMFVRKGANMHIGEGHRYLGILSPVLVGLALHIGTLV